LFLIANLVLTMSSSSQANKPFAVVEFFERGKRTVSVVSRSWLENEDNVCAWPTGPGGHQKLIYHCKPESFWSRHPCEVLKYAGTT